MLDCEIPTSAVRKAFDFLVKLNQPRRDYSSKCTVTSANWKNSSGTESKERTTKLLILRAFPRHMEHNLRHATSRVIGSHLYTHVPVISCNIVLPS